MFSLKINALHQHTEHRLAGGYWVGCSLFQISTIRNPHLEAAAAAVAAAMVNANPHRYYFVGVLMLIPMLDVDIRRTN